MSKAGGTQKNMAQTVMDFQVWKVWVAFLEQFTSSEFPDREASGVALQKQRWCGRMKCSKTVYQFSETEH